MIIKYRTTNGSWNWLSQVEELETLGYMPVAQMPTDTVRVLGTESGEPYVLRACVNGKKNVIALYAQEAYLTEDGTGNTIDILIRNEQATKRNPSTPKSRRKR